MLIQKLRLLAIVMAGVAIMLVINGASAAEGDPSDTCASAAKLFKEDDIDGALEEARWCVTQLEQLKQKQVAAFFLDEINGYKAGKLNQQQAMGFSSVERSYTKDGKKIKVSMTGGNSDTATNAFAALASMGMQMAAGNKVRIQKRSAVVNTENRTIKVIVTLKSGGMLNFESRDVSADALVAFAKKFPVAKLDESRS